MAYVLLTKKPPLRWLKYLLESLYHDHPVEP